MPQVFCSKIPTGGQNYNICYIELMRYVLLKPTHRFIAGPLFGSSSGSKLSSHTEALHTRCRSSPHRHTRSVRRVHVTDTLPQGCATRRCRPPASPDREKRVAMGLHPRGAHVLDPDLFRGSDGLRRGPSVAVWEGREFRPETSMVTCMAWPRVRMTILRIPVSGGAASTKPMVYWRVALVCIGDRMDR